MSEKVVVIASVLKPVDDTRMYEKLALSIRESKQYRVNIIGFGAKIPPSTAGIYFHTLYQGNRTALARLWAPFRLFSKLVTLRPQLVIICTPELMIPAVVYKWLNKTRLWYDVQENYNRNIKFQQAYPALAKPWLRAGVSLLENGSRPWVDHYLLAERGYKQELTFVNGKSTVLENKFIATGAGQIKSVSPDTHAALLEKPNENSPIKLVFTGTCSRENGILEAISLVTILYQCQYPVKLTVAGHIPDKKIQRWIERQVNHHPFLEMAGDGSLVPHQVLMELAADAHFGLVAHQPNPSTENCIPTKIYEYLGLKLPMILQTHPLWESVIHPYRAGIVINFNQFHPESLWKNLCETRFYSHSPGPEITWKEEAKKLESLLASTFPAH